MKVLLDENFPLPLLRALRAEGIPAEQILTLGWHSLSDREIRDRLDHEHVLFLTEDAEFVGPDGPATALVLVSRVTPSRSLAERLDLWLSGVRQLGKMTSSDRVFELTDLGDVLPWRPRPSP